MRRSDTIGALAAALAAAQGSMTAAERAAYNPHLRNNYADLQSYLVACRPHLSAQGLALVQGVEVEGYAVTVTTALLHTSGEWVESSLTLQASDQKSLSSAQVIGSVITYARRYALAALVGMSSEDDDGDGGQRSQEPAPSAPPRGGARRTTQPQGRPEPERASQGQPRASGGHSVSAAMSQPALAQPVAPLAQIEAALGRLSVGRPTPIRRSDLEAFLLAEYSEVLADLPEDRVLRLAQSLGGTVGRALRNWLDADGRVV